MNRNALLVTTAVAVLALLGPAAGIANAGDAQGRRLTATVGQGEGIVNVRPTSSAVGLSSEITVNVHGAAPGTSFYIQRSAEIGRPLGTDGICQKANGLWPWEQPNSVGYPPVPAFTTFPRPLAGAFTTLTTDADGTGVAHFFINLPTIADGTTFDVEFRLVDDLTAPSQDLRSGCFSVTAK